MRGSVEGKCPSFSSCIPRNSTECGFIEPARKEHLKQVKPLLVMPATTNRNKCSFLKELFNDEDSTTHPGGGNPRALSSFDGALSATEENSCPNGMLARSMGILGRRKNIILVKECAEGPNEPCLREFKALARNANGLLTSSKFESLTDRAMQLKIDAHCAQEA